MELTREELLQFGKLPEVIESDRLRQELADKRANDPANFKYWTGKIQEESDRLKDWYTNFFTEQRKNAASAGGEGSGSGLDGYKELLGELQDSKNNPPAPSPSESEPAAGLKVGYGKETIKRIVSQSPAEREAARQQRLERIRNRPGSAYARRKALQERLNRVRARMRGRNSGR